MRAAAGVRRRPIQHRLPAAARGARSRRLHAARARRLRLGRAEHRLARDPDRRRAAVALRPRGLLRGPRLGADRRAVPAPGAATGRTAGAAGAGAARRRPRDPRGGADRAATTRPRGDGPDRRSVCACAYPGGRVLGGLPIVNGAAIVQSDRSVLLEVAHPGFEPARGALAAFAELEKSPEHVHTYRISAVSLWNAAAA